MALVSITPPDRLVAVVSAKSVRGYPYVVAAVYELATRKSDGVAIYKRDNTPYARPHRSRRLAVADAEVLAARMGVPFWSHVRHNDTAEDAVETQRRMMAADRNREMAP